MRSIFQGGADALEDTMYMCVCVCVYIYIYIYMVYIYVVYIYMAFIFELRFFNSIQKVGPSGIRTHNLVLTMNML